MSEGVANESAASLARLVDGLNRIPARVHLAFAVPVPVPCKLDLLLFDVRLNVLDGLLFLCPAAFAPVSSDFIGGIAMPVLVLFP